MLGLCMLYIADAHPYIAEDSFTGPMQCIKHKPENNGALPSVPSSQTEYKYIS